MENLVTIIEVGAYSERQYHRTWGDNNDRHENMFYITDLQTL